MLNCKLAHALCPQYQYSRALFGFNGFRVREFKPSVTVMLRLFINHNSCISQCVLNMNSCFALFFESLWWILYISLLRPISPNTRWLLFLCLQWTLCQRLMKTTLFIRHVLPLDRGIHIAIFSAFWFLVHFEVVFKLVSLNTGLWIAWLLPIAVIREIQVFQFDSSFVLN